MLCLKQTDIVFYYRLGSLDNYCYYCYHTVKSTIDPEGEFIFVNHSHITTYVSKASKIFLCVQCERLLYDVRVSKYCGRCEALSTAYIDQVRISLNTEENQ